MVLVARWDFSDGTSQGWELPQGCQVEQDPEGGYYVHCSGGGYNNLTMCNSSVSVPRTGAIVVRAKTGSYTESFTAQPTDTLACNTVQAGTSFSDYYFGYRNVEADKICVRIYFGSSTDDFYVKSIELYSLDETINLGEYRGLVLNFKGLENSGLFKCALKPGLSVQGCAFGGHWVFDQPAINYPAVWDPCGALEVLVCGTYNITQLNTYDYDSTTFLLAFDTTNKYLRLYEAYVKSQPIFVDSKDFAPRKYTMQFGGKYQGLLAKGLQIYLDSKEVILPATVTYGFEVEQTGVGEADVYLKQEVPVEVLLAKDRWRVEATINVSDLESRGLSAYVDLIDVKKPIRCNTWMAIDLSGTSCIDLVDENLGSYIEATREEFTILDKLYGPYTYPHADLSFSKFVALPTPATKVAQDGRIVGTDNRVWQLVKGYYAFVNKSGLPMYVKYIPELSYPAEIIDENGMVRKLINPLDEVFLFPGWKIVSASKFYVMRTRLLGLK